jgi:hypothetical protein
MKQWSAAVLEATRSKLVACVFYFALGMSVAVIVMSYPALKAVFTSDIFPAWAQAILSALAIAFSLVLWAKERDAQRQEANSRQQLIDFKIALAAHVKFKLVQQIMPIVRDRIDIWHQEGLSIDRVERLLAVSKFEQLSMLTNKIEHFSLTTLKAAFEVSAWSDTFVSSVREFKDDGLTKIDADRLRSLSATLGLISGPLDAAISWFECLRDNSPIDKVYSSK